MKNIEIFLNEALIHKDSKIQAPVNYKPRQGEHDKSKLYDELWDSLSGNFDVNEKIAQRAVWLWFFVYGEEFCGKENHIVQKNDVGIFQG